jgi:hypothetical protein
MSRSKFEESALRGHLEVRQLVINDLQEQSRQEDAGVVKTVEQLQKEITTAMAWRFKSAAWFKANTQVHKDDVPQILELDNAIADLTRLLTQAKQEHLVLVQQQAEKLRIEKERLEKEQAEKLRLEQEQAEKLRLEQEQAEKLRLEQEQAEKLRLEQEQAEKLRLEQEQAEKLRLEQEQAEKLRLEQEQAEKLRLEQEQAEKLRLEQEQAEKLRLEQEQAEKLRLEQEQAEKSLKGKEDPSHKEPVDEEETDHKHAPKTSPTKTVEVEKTEQELELEYKEAVAQLIGLKPDQSVKLQAKIDELLSHVEKLYNKGENLKDLITAVNSTYFLLNDEEVMDDYLATANQMKGHASLGLKVLGILMVALGAAVAAFGVVTGLTGVDLGLTAGAGTALAATGMGIFLSGTQGGLSKSMRLTAQQFTADEEEASKNTIK